MPSDAVTQQLRQSYITLDRICALYLKTLITA